jgi:hypothetical protein
LLKLILPHLFLLLHLINQLKSIQSSIVHLLIISRTICWNIFVAFLYANPHFLQNVPSNNVVTWVNSLHVNSPLILFLFIILCPSYFDWTIMLGAIFWHFSFVNDTTKIKGNDYMDLTNKGLDNEKYFIVWIRHDAYWRYFCQT